MKITILTVGKPLTGSLKQLVQDYENRLSKYVQITWQLLPASQSRVAAICRDEESQAILRNLKSNATVVLLDERGEQYNNKTFADIFEQLAGNQGQLVFVIGGAYGVTEEVRLRAARAWSLSELVFPHQLVRLMLLEQLYRTTMLLNNHPYHHV